jgi:hypothetical protein
MSVLYILAASTALLRGWVIGHHAATFGINNVRMAEMSVGVIPYILALISYYNVTTATLPRTESLAIAKRINNISAVLAKMR